MSPVSWLFLEAAAMRLWQWDVPTSRVFAALLQLQQNHTWPALRLRERGLAPSTWLTTCTQHENIMSAG